MQSILRHWQQAVPNDRFAHLVRDTGRAFVRSLQLRLNRHDVPFGYWAFLRILWEADGLTQRELSDRAGVMEPTTFIAMKAMEKRGYVKRRRIAGNRRKVFIYLTPRGRALKRRLVPLAQEVNRIGTRGVPAAHMATTRRTLLAILANLGTDDAETAARTRRRAGR